MKNRVYYLSGLVMISLAFLGGVQIHRVTHETMSFQAHDESDARRLHRLEDSLRELRNPKREIDQTTHWLRWVAKAEKASLDDFPGLIAAAKSDGNAYRLIMDEWLRRDLAHLLRAFAETRAESINFSNYWEDPENVPLSRMREYLEEYWLDKDPAAAIPLLSRLKPSYHLSLLQSEALKQVAKGGYEKVFKKAKEWGLSNSFLPRDALIAAARTEPTTVLDAYLRFVQEQKAWNGRIPYYGSSDDILQTMVKNWAGDDPEAAMSYCSDSPQIALMKKKTFEVWTTTDFGSAAVWLGKEKDGKLQDELRPVLIDSWSRDDPESAHAWCLENLKGKRYQSALRSVVQGAMKKDLHLATDLIAAMEPDEFQIEAAKTAAEYFFIGGRLDEFQMDRSEHPREGIAWISSLEDPALLSEVLGSHARQWAQIDGEGLMAFLSDEKNAGLSDTAFVNAVWGIAGHGDFRTAIDWAGEFEGKRGDLMTERAFGEWLSREQGKALEWFDQLSVEASARPSVVETMILRAIHSPQKERLVQKLNLRDRETARQFIRDSGKSEEVISHILDLLK